MEFAQSPVQQLNLLQLCDRGLAGRAAVQGDRRDAGVSLCQWFSSLDLGRPNRQGALPKLYANAANKQG